MKKFLAGLFVAIAILFTPMVAQAQECYTLVDMQEQFKTAHTYVIEGKELEALQKKFNPGGHSPNSSIFIVQADDNVSAVVAPQDLNGCTRASFIFTIPLDELDEILTEIGINIPWAKPGA